MESRTVSLAPVEGCSETLLSTKCLVLCEMHRWMDALTLSLRNFIITHIEHQIKQAA